MIVKRGYDLTDKKFGRLTAIKMVGRASDGALVWECRCECGRIVNVEGTKLRNGRKSRCGMCGSKHSIDLSGKRFGRLTAKKFAAEKSANGNAHWFCQCDCGNTCVVDSYALRSGSTQSCGCLLRETSRKQMLTNPALINARCAGNLIDDDGVSFASKVISKRNKTGVIGVSYDEQNDHYVARLMVNGKYVLNKSTNSLEEAIQLRKDAEALYLARK